METAGVDGTWPEKMGPEETWPEETWPSGAHDRFLDAFARVVQRYGLSRARVRDVAEEVGVSRVTVYRNVGTVPEMTALLFRREVARVLPSPAGWVDGHDPVRALAATLAEIARVVRAHPVMDKVLTDEPELLGQYLVRDLPLVLEESAAVGAVVLEHAMERGRIARRDARHLAEWVARVLLTAVVAPPGGSLEAFFDAGLRPLLVPGGAATRKERT